MKKDISNKKKAEIMNHFQDQLNQYHFSGSLSASQSGEISPFSKEVCCICSETGENYVFQFGIDPHPIHISCISNSVDKNVVSECKIDNSIRNNYLPYLEEVPIDKIFSNTETFTVSKKN